MKKQWTYKYGNNTILVENTWFNGEKLYVNGELQHKNNGWAFNATLWGKLDSGEEIKVSLGGNFVINCSLFIDNKLQTPQK